jgi:hypothetical protein
MHRTPPEGIPSDLGVCRTPISETIVWRTGWLPDFVRDTHVRVFTAQYVLLCASCAAAWFLEAPALDGRGFSFGASRSPGSAAGMFEQVKDDFFPPVSERMHAS